MSGHVRREWDYSPVPDGEEFIDKHGNTVLGWHPRSPDQDEIALLAAFQAHHDAVYGPGMEILMRPILTRTASEVECRINGWEEGTLVRCYRPERANDPQPMWQIEVDPDSEGGGE